MLCDVEQHVCPAAEPEPEPDAAEPEPEPDAEEEAEPPFVAELMSLSVKVLKRRARAFGATDDEIEGINYAADRKTAASSTCCSALPSTRWGTAISL